MRIIIFYCSVVGTILSKRQTRSQTQHPDRILVGIEGGVDEQLKVGRDRQSQQYQDNPQPSADDDRMRELLEECGRHFRVPNPILDPGNPKSQRVLIDDAILHDDADCFDAITFWSIKPFFIGTNNA